VRSVVFAFILIGILSTTPVCAATTTFDATLGAAGAGGAPSGPLFSVDVGDTVRIQFAAPFATTGDAVVQVAFASPGIQYNFGAGQSIGGASTTLFQQNGLDSSSTLNLFSLFFTGCGPNCNYIDITPTAVNFGSAPLVVSSIGFGTGFTPPGAGVASVFIDSVAPAVSSAPEPSAWLLMIAGFAGITLRLKAIRKKLTWRRDLIPTPLSREPELAKIAA